MLPRRRDEAVIRADLDHVGVDERTGVDVAIVDLFDDGFSG
jgi:hypothetical protein